MDRIALIITDQTRVALSQKILENGKKKKKVFFFQTKYITATVFNADGYDYGFLKLPEWRVTAV